MTKSNFWLLVKINLRGAFDIRRYKKKKAALTSFITFFVLMGFLYLFLSTIVNFTMFMQVKETGGNYNDAVIIACGYCAMITFSTSIFRAKGIFNGNDYEMLKALPIKNRSIIASKIFSMYIVEVVYCDSQYEKSRKLTQELMEKYPNLKMVAGMNEYSSVGAARAVKAAGAKDRIQVVGVDSSQEAVQLMENGVFKGLVVQKAFKMGYIGVKETILMLRGKSYEKDVNSGCELVTPDNMYDSEIEKLLFPFNTLKLS